MSLTREQVELRSRSGARSSYLGNERLVARVLNRFLMVLDGVDLSLTPHLALDGFWESWVTAWVLAQDLTDEHVLNVGANCGYYTMIFADAVGPRGRVVAIEPQERLANLCQESALLNGFQERVFVMRAAAGSDVGRATLNVCRQTNASAFLGDGGGDPWSGPIERQEVPVTRADLAMATATFAFVDAEGYEPEVWQGMSRMERLRTLVLEWTPKRYADPEAFLSSLRAGGFTQATYIDDNGSECLATDERLLNRNEWCMLVLRR